MPADKLMKGATQFLQNKGFKNVSAYTGGIKEWPESGLLIEGNMTRKQYLKERYGIQIEQSH